MKLHMKDPQYLAQKDYYQKCFDNIKFNNDYAKYLVNKNKEINLNDPKNEKDDGKEIKNIEVKNKIEEKDNSKKNITELNNNNNLKDNQFINNINNTFFFL